MGKDFTYPLSMHTPIYKRVYTHARITHIIYTLSLSLSLTQSVVNSLSEDALVEGASRTTESELSSPSLPACSAKDRALLLALALKWRKESKTATLTPDELQECERQIWVEHIRAAMETSSVGAACSYS